MTKEQKKAHERMLATLPSRVHYCHMDAEALPGNFIVGRKGTGAVPIYAEGRLFESMREAERQTGIKRQNIYRRIVRGWKGYSYA